jgi:hypothetical protein
LKENEMMSESHACPARITGHSLAAGLQTPPRSERLIVAVLTAAALLLLGLIAWQRWNDPGAARPLENDEFHNLEYYTWAGLKPTGDQRPLRRLEDMRNLPAPSFGQLGMGIYRSVALWKTPNNHLVHTLLLDLAMLGGSPSERQIRLPAFCAAIIFAIALYALLQWGLGWRFAAPLAALGAFCLPYVYWYGNEARGYTVTLVLQVLFLAMARQAACRPTNLAWGVAQAITAILLFMNNVSMILYWLFPAYLAFWFFAPSSGASSGRLEQRHQWRRNLILQLVGIGAVGFLFLMDRLPYLLVSTQINGIEVSGTADFLAKCYGIVRYLFPGTGWAALGCLGLVGSAALCCSKENRWLGVLALGTILITVVHCWLMKKVVYPRACGYCLPMIVIGAAYLAELAWRGGNWPRRLVTLTISVVFTGVLVGESLACRCDEFDYPAAFAKLDSASGVPRQSVPYAVLPQADYILNKSLPARWLTARDGISSDSPIDRVLFLVPVKMPGDRVDQLVYLAPLEAPDKALMQRARSWEGMLESIVTGAPTEPRRVGSYQLVSVAVHSEPFSAARAFPGKTPNVVAWYPDPLRVGLFGQPVMDLLREGDVPYIRRNHRFPAHLDYYNQLVSLEFVARSAEEWNKIKGVVATGLQRFGGRAVCLNATGESGPDKGPKARETNPISREKKVERIP